ncbi:MAG: SH3 domain-containing protein [Caldilineales bacterium]|nr:SH3 domain-containing protein [Caldilineales bacterium]
MNTQNRVPFGGRRMLVVRPAHVLLAVLLWMALLLAACGPVAEPTPVIDEVFPTPPELPTAIVRTPTPIRSPATANVSNNEQADSSAESAESGQETEAQPLTSAPASGRLPGALVSVGQAALLSAPGGQRIGGIPAGMRVGLLARSPDNRWLAVRYQPDEDSPAQDGWIQASSLEVLAEIEALPVQSGDQPLATVEAQVGAPEPTTEAETGGEASGILATVLPNRLNLRAGPGVDQAVAGSMTAGELVTIIGRTGDGAWYQVETSAGRQGWAAARYLQLTGDADAVPVTGTSTSAVPAPAASSGGVSPAGGRIVFQTSNGGDIYVINANGTGLRKLTSGFDPALSPDGRQVAFTRWDEPRGLWVINSDGTGERHLISANEPRSPTWTPDGSTIIFEHVTGSVTCRKTPFGCVSEDQIDDLFGGADCIDTPFGRICKSDFPLASEPLTGLLSYIEATGSDRDLPATSDMRSPSHAAQGSDVLVLERGGYSIAESQGNAPPRRVVDLEVPLGPAVLSPDGRYIYGSRLSADHWDIWRWNSDGSGETALTAPPGIRDRPIHSVAPTVSPDGRTVLFLTDRRGSWELWLMNADGSNQRPFAPTALANIEFRYDFSADRVADWGG